MEHFAIYAVDNATFVILRDPLVNGEVERAMEAFGLGIGNRESESGQREWYDRLIPTPNVSAFHHRHTLIRFPQLTGARFEILKLDVRWLAHSNVYAIPHLTTYYRPALFPRDVETFNIVSSSVFLFMSPGDSDLGMPVPKYTCVTSLMA